MTGGIFQDYLTVLLLDAIFLLILGYVNYYVPRDQELLAKAHKPGVGPDVVIELDMHLDTIWYFVLSLLMAAITLVFFLVENSEEVASFVKHEGLIPNIIGFSTLVLAYVLTVVFFVTVCCIGEGIALKETKDHYWRHYGIMVVEPE